MANNTIKLAVYGIPPVELEEVAIGTITPGMLLARNTAGLVLPHNLADGIAQQLVAVENLVDVKAPATKAIDTDYVTGEKVYIICARRGDQMWMLLENLEVTEIGSVLTSAGNGKLQVNAAPVLPNSVVGFALEAITAGAQTRIRVEIA